MHLTNYAINKKSKDYVQNNEGSNLPNTSGDESAHKRSLSSLYQLLANKGHDVEKIKIEI
jgi:tubulin polyglutamylase TTLL6/13